MQQVLFPGDNLPLRLLSDTSIESIRDQLGSEGAVLGVICPYQVRIRLNPMRSLHHNTETKSGADVYSRVMLRTAQQCALRNTASWIDAQQ